MISIAQIAQALRTVLIDQAHHAATTHHLIKRKRRLDGAQFVQIVVGSFLAHPAGCYATMVALASDLGVIITPQGLCDRLNDSAVACLEQVLAATMQQVLAADPVVLPLLGRFPAVEVHDTTIITLPDTLAPRFAGCGGSRGQVAAAVKAPFRWELRSGRLDGPILQAGRSADRAVAWLPRAAVGALRIRDWGFWHLDDLTQDAQDGRVWLLRYKPGTALFTAEGQRQDLVDLLTTTTDDQVDRQIQLGVKQRLPCRLVARRLPAAQPRLYAPDCSWS